MVTLVEAAVRAKCGYTIVYRAALAGEIEARRVGKRWYVDVESLEEWIAAAASAGA